VVGGGVVLIATVVGAIQFDPSIMAVAVAAVPAGIVAVGSNRSTAIKATHELTAAVIGLEACTTAHYWARELRELGQEVRLMPAQYVKAHVKRNKNDAPDAEAICEAVGGQRTKVMRHKTFNHSPRLTLNGYGEERKLVPVTLPKLAWLNDTAQQQDIAERATRFVEYRTVKAGRDAWNAIGKAETFEAWKLIGAALSIGKAYALYVTGANAAWGRN
jgi:hypothetical protein